MQSVFLAKNRVTRPCQRAYFAFSSAASPSFFSFIAVPLVSFLGHMGERKRLNEARRFETDAPECPSLLPLPFLGRRFFLIDVHLLECLTQYGTALLSCQTQNKKVSKKPPVKVFTTSASSSQLKSISDTMHAFAKPLPSSGRLPCKALSPRPASCVKSFALPACHINHYSK